MEPAIPFAELEEAHRAQLEQLGAPVSNLYLVLANNPLLLRAWLDFAWTLRSGSETSRRLREIAILRCAQLAESAYQWADHVEMAAAAGVTEAQIAALARWPESSEFDADERLVLQLVDEVVAGRVSDASVQQLSERFAPAALVELVLTAAFYVMVPRVLEALRVPHPSL